MGIKKENIAKLAKPFITFETNGKNKEGIGLGLSSYLFHLHLNLNTYYKFRY